MNCINTNSETVFNEVEDSFQAFLVNGAHFTLHEEYPILCKEMLTSTIPQNIMPFNKAINYHGDLSNTFICFYSPDKSFERIRRNPQLYLDFFKRTAGIIGFDFSVHSDMPIIKQKSQMNDNLSLSFYYGSHNVPVIPNIRCGDNQLLDEYLSAIPKKTNIAVGSHGFCKETREKCEWYCFLEKIIQILEPPAIIVYGTLNGKLFDTFKKSTQFVFYDSWISHRYKEVQRNVN